MRQGSFRQALALLAFLLVLLTGCADSSSDDGDANLTVSLTDAASDELASFTVEFESIRLTKASGEEVGALANPLDVDLLTLSEVSQVLSVLSVPAGLYTSATVTMDFTDAEAYAIGNSNPAVILDGDGNPLTGQVTLPILVVGAVNAIASRNQVLELDFDLDQSVSVDQGANAVHVEPVIVLRVDRSDPKDLLVGGEIQSVDVTANTLEVELQTLGGVRLGDVTVVVENETVYQIDGVPLQGAAGLAQLGNGFVGNWVQCYGEVDPLAARICANYVEAGAGTYNGGTDIVEGHITSRIGGAGTNPILSVLGHSNNASHTSFFFNSSFTVTASQLGSTVVRRGGLITYDADSLSIGQRVRIFGTLSGFTLDAASAGTVIRLQPTRVLGFANDAIQATTLDFELERVGVRDASAFTWNDSGTTPPDPDAFLAEVGNLGDGLGVVAMTAVEVIGFFAPVDDDQADFEGEALINLDRAPSLLAIHDRFGGLNIQTSVTTSDIQFDLSGTAGLFEFAVIDRGFVGIEDLPTSSSVVPAFPLGVYLISDRVTGSVSLHLEFTAFAQTLDASLAVNAEIYNFGSVGTYDAANASMDAFLIVAVIQ